MKKILLMILDGWGISPDIKGNAIKAANTPNLDKFLDETPKATLKTSGLDVGLPEGVMGNSEVGHMNIGAGRVVDQLNTFIDKQIENGEFFKNKVLNDAIQTAKNRKTKMHLFALLSDGNVHSNLGHIYAMLQLCADNGVQDVYMHAFMDGRDTLPHSGIGFLEDYLKRSKELKLGNIATISGRYYAMDRDKRWNRVELAYNAIVRGIGEKYEDPLVAIKDSYEKGVSDEFIIPKVITKDGKPVAKVESDDVIVFLNYRADRTRQITSSLILPDFKDFKKEELRNIHFVSMSEYDVNFNSYLNVAYRAPELKNTLGEVLAANKINELRLAETEKYAHVTFFFNCGKEKPFEFEDRVLIPSPKVASYDLQPEMSAYKIKDVLVKALRDGKHNLIVVNFANCDMVGHTGVFEAAVEAVEAVDRCVGEVVAEAISGGYDIILTADHGNAEKMLDEDNNIFTAHSTNPVPIVIRMSDERGRMRNDYKVHDGRLADIAPTILTILGISLPCEMDGEVLVSYS